MLFSLLVCVLKLSVAFAFVPLPPQFHKELRSRVSSTTWNTFEQPIDHRNPSIGTFQQRYWYSTEFWRGPGSPVILFNPGEGAVLGTNGDFTGYLGDVTLIGQYSEAVGGAAIVIEHRYWGESSPFTNLTTENLQYLTVYQAIQDMKSFAEGVLLPFDTTGASNSQNAPWIFVGGSYSGSLAAWMEVIDSGSFWAYHASSAPVQSIADYWQYYYPMLQGLASNCSADIEAVVSRVDTVLTNGTKIDKEALKTTFGLGIVVHDDDFARTIALPLDSWQDGISNFLPFCDALEGAKAGVTPTASAIGLTAALPNYSRYINQHYACTSLDCYDTYNLLSALYVDTTLDVNVIGGRQWQWMLCNEGFGWWQTGAPVDQQSLVSRLVTAQYFEQECGFYFPDTKISRTQDQNNFEYMGWNIQNTTRLMLSNGEFDPWRSAGVTSEFRPGGPVASTPEMPIFLIPGAVHAQDLYMNNVTPDVLDTRSQEIAQLKAWIDEFYQQTPGNTTSTTLTTTATTLPSPVRWPNTTITTTPTSSSIPPRSTSLITSYSFSLTVTRSVVLDPPQATKSVKRSRNLSTSGPPRASARTSNPHFNVFPSFQASRTPKMNYVHFTPVPMPWPSFDDDDDQ